MDNDLIVAIGSRNFFGAERRFFKISKYVNGKKESRLNIYLIINSSLYLSAIKVEWAKVLLLKFEHENKLIIIPDNIKNIFLSRGLFRLFKLISAKRFRAILHGRILSLPRLLLKRDTIFEVTSIDEAKHIVQNYPKFILKNVRCFNCVSETVAKDFICFSREAGYNLLTSKIKFDKFPFFNSQDEEENLEKNKTIVFASRFIERKNPILFANSCKKLLENFSDWNIYICGKGPLEEEIKYILQEYIEKKRVKVLYSTKIEEILKKSTIYVSLIEPDNYPSQSILEAMYYANALLISNTGTSNRFISKDQNNINGILCELNTIDIYDNLVKMCENFEYTKNMGLNSKKLLDENFSSNNYINKFLEITNEADL